ncbi:MAG TPA: flavin monoamine oxidase family protein [Verrucomicrobiae bacterium]|nr:flavin monoamine oxidase family protein [Verrucomicrobiae bacterium]
MEKLDLTRRQLILGAAAAGAVTALPGCGNSSAADGTLPVTPAQGALETDVAIVGAGLAGLACARELVKAGRSCMVLEARDRVGGRTLNGTLPDGQPIEIGGQWVGPTQDRILALAAELGVGTYKTYDTGQYIDYRNGVAAPYGGFDDPSGVGANRIPPTDPSAAAEAGEVIERLNQMAAEVPPEAPWSAPSSAEWDGQTFQSWMDQNMATPGGKSLVALAIEAVFSAQPRDLSLLHLLFYIRAAGNLNNLINTTNGAQDSRFHGGSQLVSIRAAQGLGDRVFLNSRVDAIAQDATGVTVSGAGFAVRARQVVVAVPPTLAARIRYAPGLPALRDQMAQRMPMGSVIKLMCVYERPFWRDATLTSPNGLAGQATSDQGPVKITFDNSPDGPNPAFGVLMGFMEGTDGREWSAKTTDERRTAAIECFVRYFGAQAANPLAYLEQDWMREEYSRGGYGGMFPPGGWLDFGRALTEPVGRIHWAGTETSPIWNGYMDGAVRSGERAAAAVIARL